MRLKRHFDYMFSGGRRVESRAFRIHFRVPLFDTPAVAFVATKKQGCAVERNRSKRRLRELYRQSNVAPQIKVDMVIITKRAVLSWKYDALMQDFNWMLNRICFVTQSEMNGLPC